jgi:hypothetical protein
MSPSFKETIPTFLRFRRWGCYQFCYKALIAELITLVTSSLRSFGAVLTDATSKRRTCGAFPLPIAYSRPRAYPATRDGACGGRRVSRWPEASQTN